MFLTMFFKTQNIEQTMHLTMLIAHPYPHAAQQWWKLIKTYETYVDCRYLCTGIFSLENEISVQNSVWNSKGWLVQYNIVH